MPLITFRIHLEEKEKSMKEQRLTNIMTHSESVLNSRNIVLL